VQLALHTLQGVLSLLHLFLAGGKSEFKAAEHIECAGFLVLVIFYVFVDGFFFGFLLGYALREGIQLALRIIPAAEDLLPRGAQSADLTEGVLLFALL
jgi:hypothetical protein